MKVILLASGRSFRMRPLTDKNFLDFCGKPLLVHQIEALKRAGVREIVIVGGKHNLARIRKLRAPGVKLSVVEQKDLDEGMAGGVLAAKSKFKKGEGAIVVSTNDVVESSLYKGILNAEVKCDGIIVGKKMKKYFPGGYLSAGRRGFIEEIVEKPKPGAEPSDVINLVVHRFENVHELFAQVGKACSKNNDPYEVTFQRWFLN